eukprot:COSAG02_NODE_1628_length_11586_cov_3.954644_4_plen_257_part_00
MLSSRCRPGGGGAGLSVLNARKTARDLVLMAEAWVRTHSIGRTGPHRPTCKAATSAMADAACLGCGNAVRTVVRVCIGRLSVVARTAHARWCSPFAAVCLAEVLPVITADAGRALGPMLPSSARECWPFCVLRDSCHAALPDQPGSPSIGSGRWTGGSRRRPHLIRLANGRHFMDDVGAWPCCVGMSLSNRKSTAQNGPLPRLPKIEPSRDVCVQLRAFRRHAERPCRSRSCRHVCPTRERRSVRACARCVYVSSE